MRDLAWRFANYVTGKLAAPKRPGSLTFYRRKDGTVGWNVRSANGERVLPGEGHRDTTDCIRAIRSGMAILSDPNIHIMDLTKVPHIEPEGDAPIK